MMEKLHRARYTLEYKLEALPSLGFRSLDNRLRVVVPDEASGLEAILLGLGCGFLPEAVAQPCVNRGELKLLKVKISHPPSDSAVAWRAGEGSRALHWWAQRLTTPSFVRRLFG